MKQSFKQHFLAQYGHEEHIDEALSSTNDVYVRRAAAENISATKKQLERFLDDGDLRVRARAASSVAGNPDSTKQMLDKALAANISPDVHLKVIEHPNISKKSLDFYLKHKNDKYRIAAARNPSITPDRLDKALRDNYEYVRAAAASNPNATKEHLDKAASDWHYAVVANAINNKNATKEHLDMAMKNTAHHVRWNIAAHALATKEHLDKLIDDESPDVRFRVARHRNATKEHLIKALRDRPDVRYHAINNPKAKEYGLV